MREIKVYVTRSPKRTYFQMRYIDPVTGEAHQRSSRAIRRREAEKVAAKWEHDLREGRFKEPSKITWIEFRHRYEDEVLAGKAAGTAAKACSAFNHVEQIIRPKMLVSITADAISRFQKELRDKDLAESTIKGHLAYLKAALRWANRKKLLVEVPDIDMPTGGGMKGRAIATEEFERILPKVSKMVGSWAADSWLFLLWGLWWSGLRLGEALNLSWDDRRLLCVDFTGRRPMFLIQAHAHKSRKDCILPMAPEFAKFLMQTPDEDRTGYVFNPPSRRASGGRLGLDSVSKTICCLGEAAGVKVAERHGKNGVKVKYASAQDFRRAFGFRWANRVMPVILQQLMRHESISTTMEFYVGRNAEAAADVLWEAVGDTLGDTDPVLLEN
jgi:integrase